MNTWPRDESTGAGNRRDFLKTAAATSAATVLTTGASVQADPPKLPPTPLPIVTLGKTGQKVTNLGMGTSWQLQPAFVQAAIFAGVRYIDTSESYENTRVERILGQVLERTGLRKDVYLVTKNSRGKVGGPDAYKTYSKRLQASLERLRTDYIDCYYLHGVSGREIKLFSDPDVKAAFEKLKKEGKIRFCGLSCHDPRLPEIVTAAAECGWIDQMMIQYNYRTMNSDDVRRALDVAHKANLATVAMKTQGGAGHFREVNGKTKFNEFLEKGFKKEQAAIKTVLADERVHLVVSEMTNRSMLRENMAACRNIALSAREIESLEQYRLATSHLYCHGCGHHCEPVAGNVPIADMLRYLRYAEVYGKPSQARELYQALSPAARKYALADLQAAQAACPHGLPVVELIQRADKMLG